MLQPSCWLLDVLRSSSIVVDNFNFRDARGSSLRLRDSRGQARSIRASFFIVAKQLWIFATYGEFVELLLDYRPGTGDN
ncbi:hypothetical protein RRG08_000671 [Elysia crispata]|uniref:Uncharacterized protein n=1 Tax=Elysia crispata TaxID=231223 RepID=A0AAE1CYS5_9GAST|nr:hypothetical protein RRG08_000671 [Elysia crispata]